MCRTPARCFPVSRPRAEGRPVTVSMLRGPTDRAGMAGAASPSVFPQTNRRLQLWERKSVLRPLDVHQAPSPKRHCRNRVHGTDRQLVGRSLKRSVVTCASLTQRTRAPRARRSATS
eukprot:scaffold592_cov124-Isochrysis_galbana.AAC.1